MKKTNRMAFTLIELLAVIVILGILLITAIPAITRNIVKSRRNTFWQNAKSAVQAATTQYLDGEFVTRTGGQNLGYAVDSNAACPIPGIGYYVTIPYSDIELEQGDKEKSSFNSKWHNYYEPIIVIVNEGKIENGEEKDDLQWYFAGIDNAGNGIEKLTNVNELNISSVKTGLKVISNVGNFSIQVNGNPPKCYFELKKNADKTLSIVNSCGSETTNDYPSSADYKRIATCGRPNCTKNSYGSVVCN